MEPVSMNDGLDGREPIAFGLAAGELGVFVVSLMAAYVVLQSGVAGAVAWAAAATLGLAGAMLAWGRLAGRPLADWAVLLLRYLVRTRARRLAAARALAARAAGSARQRVGRFPTRRGRAQAGALVIPLALHRPDRAAATVTPSRAHVVVFFSLNGGTGRTTLAVELASLLAARGAAERAAGGRGLGVALIDLTARSPAVALRLGLPLAPAAVQRGLIRRRDGLRVAVSPFDPGDDAAAAVDAAVEGAQAAGCRLVVLDIDCDLGAVCRAALQRSDRVLVTLTGDTGGVLDAYRSTALLRRLGLRDRIDYVVNRCRARVDLAEPMGDLGGRVLAQVPERPAFCRAELGGLAAEVRGRILDPAGAQRDGTAG